MDQDAQQTAENSVHYQQGGNQHQDLSLGFEIGIEHARIRVPVIGYVVYDHAP